jgi:hypothetical protein
MAKRRQIALHGGRTKLGRPSRAEIEREAHRIATEAAGLSGLRVPEDASPAARQAADWALQRIRDVAEGRVSFRLAASTLKAAITIREEICGAIETKSRVTGTMTLEQAVAAAAERAGGRALPPASTPEPAS